MTNVHWVGPRLGSCLRIHPWAALAVLIGLAGGAVAQDVGVVGPGLGGSGPAVGNPSVTESKPESKVWYQGGSWWGSLWSEGSLEFRIHRLESGAWVDTGVAIDTRPDSHSDALAEDGRVYVASHEFSQGGGSNGRPMYVYRYTRSGATYALDAGFPVQVGNVSTEAMVIARDSTDTLWAVWTFAQRVYFTHTVGGDDTVWTTPAILPVCTTDISTDDICSAIAFAGDRVGVMWSDQVAGNWSFTWHVDGDDDATWATPETLLPGEANDMINLKTDATGRVFCVLRTSVDNTKLLERDAAGTWHEHLVGGPGDNLNRPIVLLDEEDRLLHVFAQTGSGIHQKTTSLDAIAFAAGQGTVVIRDADATVVNPTSHKQGVSARTGLVVLAANNSTSGNYWHHEVPRRRGGFVLTGPVPTQGGSVSLFRASGAAPHALVALVADPDPSGGGAPVVLGLARADAAGDATFAVRPLSERNGPVVLRAVHPAARGVTEPVALR